VLHYDGSQWQVMPIGTTDYLWSIWASGPNDIYVMSTKDTMFHYDGEKWAPFPAPPTGLVSPMWGTGGRLYVVGGGSTVMSLRIH